MELKLFGFKILDIFQGPVNKMTVTMKLTAMGPIDIPPSCNAHYCVILWLFSVGMYVCMYVPQGTSAQ
jgi:hypothetical protein